jgi:PDZ and LIM domain protein 5/6/7
MCGFHYHQANHSLCVSPSCGKPIEGACAITFLGDRYHPECLRCGYKDCDEHLEDYWEVDGMMLCERHAQRVEECAEEDDDVGELGRIASVRRPARHGSGEARAQKRTTRLINLSGGF